MMPTHNMRYDVVTHTADAPEHGLDHDGEMERVESLSYRVARRHVLEAAPGTRVLARTRTERLDGYGRRLRFVLSVEDGR